MADILPLQDESLAVQGVSVILDQAATAVARAFLLFLSADGAAAQTHG
jgi:hypothetical protein